MELRNSKIQKRDKSGTVYEREKKGMDKGKNKEAKTRAQESQIISQIEKDK